MCSDFRLAKISSYTFLVWHFLYLRRACCIWDMLGCFSPGWNFMLWGLPKMSFYIFLFTFVMLCEFPYVFILHAISLFVLLNKESLLATFSYTKERLWVSLNIVLNERYYDAVAHDGDTLCMHNIPHTKYPSYRELRTLLYHPRISLKHEVSDSFKGG